MPRLPRALRTALSAWALLCLASAATSAASVASAPGDTTELPAARARAAGDAVPGVQSIPAEDLARRENLADALRAVPGFRVRTQAGMGGYAETWFRGSDGRQVSVYLDGLLLNSSLDPAVDLGKIPVLAVRGLEVDKAGWAGSAGGAALDGPEGGAAAIRLSTYPLGHAPVSVTGRLSSFGGQEGALSAKAGRGDAAFLIDAGVQGARNDYPFPTDNGTTYVRGDDFGDAMRNNAYRGRWLGLAWRESGSGGRGKGIGLRWSEHRKEYPGLYTSASEAFTTREEILLHADWRDSLPSAGWGGWGPLRGFALGAQGRLSSDAFRDPGKTLGYRTFSLDRDGRHASGSAALLADMPWGASLRLGSRAGYEESRSEETEGFREYQPPDAERAFAEPSVSLETALLRKAAPGGLRARAEGVWTWEDFRSRQRVGIGATKTDAPLERETWSRTWRMALALAPRPAEASAPGPRLAGLAAELESVERLPALHEILGDNNGVQRNMGLKPQSTLGASLEAAGTWGPLQVTGGPFWQHGRAPIRLGPLGASNFLAFDNGADWRSYGLEARLDARGPRWRLGQSLTAANPVVLRGPAAGNLPAYSSRLETAADASVSPLPALWLDADLEFRTSYFPDDYNLPGTRRPAETVVGAGIRWRRKRLEAALRGDNLGDSQYRDFAYSPKSGRRWSFRLSMNP